MSCEQCSTSGSIEIRRPGDLGRAISHCRALVSSKVLVPSSYWPPRTLKSQFVPWGDLSEKGPWDDIVQYYFSCSSCQQLFALQADTYHGAGGRFGRYEPSA